MDASERKWSVAVDDDTADEVSDEEVDDCDHVKEVGARQGLSGVGVARSQEVVVVPHANDGWEEQDGVREQPPQREHLKIYWSSSVSCPHGKNIKHPPNKDGELHPLHDTEQLGAALDLKAAAAEDLVEAVFLLSHL